MIVPFRSGVPGSGSSGRRLAESHVAVLSEYRIDRTHEGIVGK